MNRHTHHTSKFNLWITFVGKEGGERVEGGGGISCIEEHKRDTHRLVNLRLKVKSQQTHACKMGCSFLPSFTGRVLGPLNPVARNFHQYGSFCVWYTAGSVCYDITFKPWGLGFQPAGLKFNPLFFRCWHTLSFLSHTLLLLSFCFVFRSHMDFALSSSSSPLYSTFTISTPVACMLFPLTTEKCTLHSCL
jgi:hypothetical protein